ncbi:hypothetical protein, variant 2 [Aphanomyces astaci]|uniref:Coenzyme Q-binding protein COQ10 START domain-containing protein n=1 Tax=Aphanomyces astaci TaxID=112090 RepID=W4FYQ8_APHAT|nr:hypothetical protein, variant 2 [Aphanomyces astaci]ETV72592.1 hypothetical protein, variant 2 [Aphanomyces astaci]|eukprot:XP_009837820.1 hypothetical protein, variant 2 [Aphanomyces astaci]
MATSTRWRAAGVASRMLMARRCFLTVPEFLQPSSLRKEHREKKVVPFPCQAMFDVVANVDEYVTFLPFCVTSRVVSRPSSNSMEADLTVGFQIFTETYRSRVVLESPRRILIKSINSPTFKSIESEWTFRPVSTTSCEVNFRVSFEVGSILHAHAMRLFFDDVARVQLNAFIGQASKLQQQRQLAQKRQQQSPPEPTPAGKPWTVPFLQGKVPAPVLAHLKHVFIAHATAEAGTYKLSLAGFGAACHDLVHTSPWAKASPTVEDLKSISANSQSALAFAVFASYIMPSQHQPHTHEQPPHRQELSFTEFAVQCTLHIQQIVVISHFRYWLDGCILDTIRYSGRQSRTHVPSDRYTARRATQSRRTSPRHGNQASGGARCVSAVVARTTRVGCIVVVVAVYFVDESERRRHESGTLGH